MSIRRPTRNDEDESDNGLGEAIEVTSIGKVWAAMRAYVPPCRENRAKQDEKPEGGRWWDAA